MIDSYNFPTQLNQQREEGEKPASDAFAIVQQSDKKALARLLALALADAQAGGRTINLESSEEISRLIPVLCSCFSREELAQLVGERLAAKFLDMQRIEVLQNLFLERELQHILHAFNEAEIPLMLFKGPALAHTVYPEASQRTYHDLDMLIHAGDLARAHDLLTSLGYTYYEEFRGDAIDNKRTGYNYTLKRPGSWLEVLVELHFAPHPGQGGNLFEPDAMWARAQRITVLGEPTLTMHVVDHLLYLCWHYRFHGFTRLIWLYDIVVMLRAGGSSLDWDELVEAARHLRLAANLYYCLAWCRDLFGVAIPEQVFARLHPPLPCRVVVERWTMSDPARALSSARWQSLRMIARRVMIDNPFGLIASGIHTLFPRPAIMGRRYMNNSRLPMQFVYLFYFIHPWITLAKGCRNLLKRKGGKQR